MTKKQHQKQADPIYLLAGGRGGGCRANRDPFALAIKIQSLVCICCCCPVSSCVCLGTDVLAPGACRRGRPSGSSRRPSIVQCESHV